MLTEIAGAHSQLASLGRDHAIENASLVSLYISVDGLRQWLLQTGLPEVLSHAPEVTHHEDGQAYVFAGVAQFVEAQQWLDRRSDWKNMITLSPKRLINFASYA